VAKGGRWALVGCTVAPGFEFSDLELADPTTLTASFPAHAEIIAALTR
jgi:predicted cupin superfamily sugar epimerase